MRYDDPRLQKEKGNRCEITTSMIDRAEAEKEAMRPYLFDARALMPASYNLLAMQRQAAIGASNISGSIYLGGRLGGIFGDYGQSAGRCPYCGR